MILIQLKGLNMTQKNSRIVRIFDFLLIPRVKSSKQKHLQELLPCLTYDAVKSELDGNVSIINSFKYTYERVSGDENTECVIVCRKHSIRSEEIVFLLQWGGNGLASGGYFPKKNPDNVEVFKYDENSHFGGRSCHVIITKHGSKEEKRTYRNAKTKLTKLTVGIECINGFPLNRIKQAVKELFISILGDRVFLDEKENEAIYRLLYHWEGSKTIGFNKMVQKYGLRSVEYSISPTIQLDSFSQFKCSGKVEMDLIHDSENAPLQPVKKVGEAKKLITKIFEKAVSGKPVKVCFLNDNEEKNSVHLDEVKDLYDRTELKPIFIELVNERDLLIKEIDTTFVNLVNDEIKDCVSE